MGFVWKAASRSSKGGADAQCTALREEFATAVMPSPNFGNLSEMGFEKQFSGPGP